MQEVRSFVQGKKLGYGENKFEATPIENQINNFLAENANHIIKTFNVIMGPSYIEAFVVFDIREEPKQKSDRIDYEEFSKKFEATPNKQHNVKKEAK